MILRTIHCDVCGMTQTENMPGAGWPGWGELRGVQINGAVNPCLCPQHLAVLAQVLDKEIPK